MKRIITIIMLLCMFIMPMNVGAASAEPKEDKPQVHGFEHRYNGFAGCFYLGDYDGIEIYRATSKNGKYTKIDFYSYDSRPQEKYIKVEGLTTDKTYYFKVRNYSFDKKGKKKSSDWLKFTYTPHLQSTGLSISVSDTGKKEYCLYWWGVEGAHGFNLYRTKNGKAYQKILDTKNAHYRVKTKNNYTYRIRAYRKVKGKFVYSPYSYVDANWKYLNNLVMG